MSINWFNRAFALYAVDLRSGIWIRLLIGGWVGRDVIQFKPQAGVNYSFQFSLASIYSGCYRPAISRVPRNAGGTCWLSAIQESHLPADASGLANTAYAGTPCCTVCKSSGHLN